MSDRSLETRLRFLGQPWFLLCITFLLLSALGLSSVSVWLSQRNPVPVSHVSRREENPVELVLAGRARVAPGLSAVFRVLVKNGREQQPFVGSQVLLALKDRSERRTELVVHGTTDEQGYAIVTLALPRDLQEGAYQVVATAETPLGSTEIAHKVLVQRGVRISIEPEKTRLQRGETLRVRLTGVWSDEGRPLANEGLWFTITDSHRRKIYKQRLMTSPDGVVAAEFPIVEQAATGVYRIDAAFGAISCHEEVSVGIGLDSAPANSSAGVVRRSRDENLGTTSDSFEVRSPRYESHPKEEPHENSPRRRAIAIAWTAPFVVFVVLCLLAAFYAAIGLWSREPIVVEGSERTELYRTTRHLLLAWFVGLYVPPLFAVTAGFLTKLQWNEAIGALLGIALTTGVLGLLARRAIRSAGLTSVPLFRAVVATVPGSSFFGGLSCIAAVSTYHQENLFEQPFVMKLDDVAWVTPLLGLVYGGFLSVARLSVLHRLSLRGWFWALLSRPLLAASPVLAMLAIVSVKNHLPSRGEPKSIQYDGTPFPVEPEDWQSSSPFGPMVGIVLQPARPIQGTERVALPLEGVGQDGVAYAQTRSGCLGAEATETMAIPDIAIDGSNDLYLQLHSASFLQHPGNPVPLYQGNDIHKFVANDLEIGSIELSTMALYADYLRKLGDLAPVTIDNHEEEILRTLKAGCAGLLTQEHAHGGLLWGRSSTPNAFLTAYGLAALIDSAKVISVDPQVLGRIRGWLVKQQFNGRYSGEVGQHVAPSNQPLVGADLHATAFIAWILGQAGETTALSPVLDVLAATPSSQDIYATALQALALGTAGRTAQASPLIERLASFAVQTGDYVYFTLNGEVSERPHEETTALSVQALLLSKRHTETAHRALRWLLHRQREPGSNYAMIRHQTADWASHRARMQVIRALHAAVLSASMKKDAQVEIRVNGTPLPTLRIASDQRDVTQLISLRKLVRRGENTIILSSSGGGEICYKLVATHMLPWSTGVGSEQRPISVSAHYGILEGNTNGRWQVDMQVSWTLPGILPLAVLDVELPDGFDVSAAALTEDERRGVIVGWQQLPGQIRIYLRNLEHGRPLPLFYGIVGHRAPSVKWGTTSLPTTLGKVRVYPYLHPDQAAQTTIFLRAPSRGEFSVHH